MDRILRGTAATVYFTISVAGTATDPSPDQATVRAVRADGTELQGETSAADTGTGQFAYTFSSAQTALLDTITLYWTLTISGYQQVFTTTVEIVGGFLFGISEARTLRPLDNATQYPASAIIAMRTLVEDALEEACCQAFVPRYTVETLSGTGDPMLALKWPHVTSIRSVSIEGTAYTPSGFAASTTGLIYYQTGFTAGFNNITVGYEHGRVIPPPRVTRAALRLARRWLVEGPVDDRATSMSNDDGTFSLVTPGLRGALFDLPEVNAVVDQYRMSVGVA